MSSNVKDKNNKSELIDNVKLYTQQQKKLNIEAGV